MVGSPQTRQLPKRKGRKRPDPHGGKETRPKGKAGSGQGKAKN
ncbi:MAG TPA: hypothetical protein VHI93_03840 [Candidatus Thermoplasmatota archaeon]|nr:hypothetical protein [Candidatus Thermoplasmatota archaeon]